MRAPSLAFTYSGTRFVVFPCRLWDMKSPKDPKAEASIKALLADRKAAAKAAGKSAAGTACAPTNASDRLWHSV